MLPLYALVNPVTLMNGSSSVSTGPTCTKFNLLFIHHLPATIINPLLGQCHLTLCSYMLDDHNLLTTKGQCKPLLVTVN